MLTFHSPAKINLFLRILGKRPDGYHELASLFQAIGLMDVLHFSLADEDQLTCTDPLVPTDHSNLIWKAVRLFQSKTSLVFHVKIHLEKNIPMQAGLGGGSSNAATTLWALNILLKTRIPTETLMQWAGQLGSDVPFFFSSGTAYCTGRGEIVQSLAPLSQRNVTIAVPSQGLSTPLVYSRLDLSTLPQRDPLNVLHHFKANPQYFNDLEEAAFRVLPELSVYKHSLLSQGFEMVLLSGSGSSFFCFGSPSLPIKNTKAVHFVQRTEGTWY